MNKMDLDKALELAKNTFIKSFNDKKLQDKAILSRYKSDTTVLTPSSEEDFINSILSEPFDKRAINFFTKSFLSKNEIEFILTQKDIIIWESIKFAASSDGQFAFPIDLDIYIRFKNSLKFEEKFFKIVRPIIIQKLTDKLFQKFKENIQKEDVSQENIQEFSDFLRVTLTELQDSLGDRLNGYVRAFVTTMKRFNSQTDESSSVMKILM